MNIFLVEDERWALAELVELFKVYEPLHTVYAFDNGEDALSAAISYRPKLIISDINMPGIDGLELIQTLMQMDGEITGIIITGHDQFSYAQKGLKIGVMDYLLKPVKPDILYRTVDQALLKIGNEKKHREERENWSITQMLLASSFPDNELSLYINDHDYCLVMLLLENLATDNCWQEAPFINSDIIKHVVEKSMDDRNVYCLDMDAQRKVLLVPVMDHTQIRNIHTHLLSLYRELNHSGLIVHLAFVLKKERESIQKSFLALNKQMEDHMIFGAPTFIPPDAKYRDADFRAVWDKVRVLESQFIKGEILKGKETIHRILSEFQKMELTVKQLQLFLNDLFYSLKYNLLSSGRMDIQTDSFQEDLKVIYQFSSYEKLAVWLENMIWSLYRESDTTDIKPKELIPLVMNWIRSNYQTNISLQQFAVEHHVSLGYLSRLFKVQIGDTFSDYLIRYRIDKAKELLAQGIDRLSDVSRMVGYEDPKHFSQLFKRMVGETPNAYGKRVQSV